MLAVNLIFLKREFFLKFFELKEEKQKIIVV